MLKAATKTRQPFLPLLSHLVTSLEITLLSFCFICQITGGSFFVFRPKGNVPLAHQAPWNEPGHTEDWMAPHGHLVRNTQKTTHGASLLLLSYLHLPIYKSKFQPLPTVVQQPLKKAKNKRWIRPVLCSCPVTLTATPQTCLKQLCPSL